MHEICELMKTLVAIFKTATHVGDFPCKEHLQYLHSLWNALSCKLGSAVVSPLTLVMKAYLFMWLYPTPCFLFLQSLFLYSSNRPRTGRCFPASRQYWTVSLQGIRGRKRHGCIMAGKCLTMVSLSTVA